MLGQHFLIVTIDFKVFQIHLIFTPIKPPPIAGNPKIYLYGDYFELSGNTTTNDDGDLVPEPAAGTDMFLLHQQLRGGVQMRDVIPLTSVCELVQLVPNFGAKIDSRYDSNTSLEIAQEFHLNNFANKNTFRAILTYQ